ncbi:MAG: PilW family protein [Bdellovibrionales bacterium]|nr:PilW family protein [Ramlibacter sp.]
MRSIRRQVGRTLIELMISITIGLAVMAAIVAIYSATTSTSRQADASQRMSEDAAVTLNLLGTYFRMAGFSFPQANVATNTVTAGSATFQVKDSNFSGTAIRGCDNGFSNPTVSATTSLTCNGSAGPDAVVVRFEADTSNTFPTTDSPPQASDCLSQGISNNGTSDFDGTTAYTVMEARFYLRSGTASGTRDLYCGGNGTSTFSAQPLIQYVDDLVLAYGVAVDVSSHQVVQYMTSAQIDALGGTMDANWGRVISVKLCIVMRSESADQAGVGSYVDCSGSVVTASDKYQRRAFSSVVGLRNRGGFVL